MMKTLYLECNMGAAGDMLTAALLELLPDPDAFLARLNSLGIPGVTVTKEQTEKCGVVGTHVHVLIGDEEEIPAEDVAAGSLGGHEHHHDQPQAENRVHIHVHEHHHGHVHSHETEYAPVHDAHDHDHGHTHSHDHSHSHGHASHEHRGMTQIREIIESLPLSEKVRADALAVYEEIAAAESHAHGMPVEEIHFHEVGSLDAVTDVVAVCMLMEEIGADRIEASAVHAGSGQVRSAHGILPVPAPATEFILRGIPWYGGSISGELCTPTGAALLKHFVVKFGARPVMRVEKTGYGMGTKDFPAANCVRVFLGETEESGRDEVFELACNLDDMTAEQIGFAAEELMAAGALDVWTQPIGMKKNRPGTMLSVLSRESDKDKLRELLFRHTTTLGVRERAWERTVLSRRQETAETPWGPVRVKVSEGSGVVRRKAEYEDLAEIARKNGLSLSEVIERISASLNPKR